MNPKDDCSMIEQMIAAMPLAAYAADENWKIVFFNKAAEELTGVPVNEAVGMRVRDVFNGAIGKKGCPIFDGMTSGRSVDGIDVKFKDNEDHEKVCQISARPLLGKDGKSYGSMGFLKASDGEGGAAFDYLNSLPTPVMVMDKDLKVIFMNAHALEMVGKSLDQVLGKPCHEFMHTDHCKGGNCATRKAMAEDRTFIGDAVAHLPGGDKPVRGMVGPLKDSKGTIVGAVEFILDISKEVEITKEVHRIVGETLAGNLKARAEVGSFDGNYKTIIMGFNDALESVINPMTITAMSVEMIAKGDLSHKIEADFKGDMNLIKININTCIDSIRNLVSDAGELADAANRGEFSKRADASRHQGDFREVISGVNKTLDLVVDKMFWYEQILDAVPFPVSVTDMDMNMTFLNKPSLEILKVKKGDLLGKQCHEWKGPICRTKNCGIVRLRNGEGRTISDRDGKALQVDVQYIKNAKGESIGHVEVLQDITATTRKAKYDEAEVERLARNLQLIAVGDMNLDTKVAEADRYTTDNKDNFQKIMDNMIKAKEAINSLVVDTNDLSKAAVEGTLSTRADASKHQGEYQKVIQGVNDTLDAVIGPLKVAAAYMEKISKGDIPAKINKEYKGDFNNIKDNLNQCIDSINALVTDADFLARSAMNGQLDTRAEVSRHGGKFKAIVDGVNKTLDSIVGNFEAIPTPIMFMDKDLRIQYINKQGAKALGKNKVELRGVTCASMWKTSKCHTEECPCVGAMKNDVLVTCENDLMKNGHQLDIFCAGAPLHDDEGKVIGAFEFVTDQTAVKSAVRRAEKVNVFQAETVEQITSVLEQIASGDLLASIELNEGDEDTKEAYTAFENLYSGIDHLKAEFRELIVKVNESIDMVSSTSQELASSAEEMNASTEQVSAAIQQISKGAQSQAAQVEETARIMADISTAVIQVVDKTTATTEAAKKGAESANRGKVSVDNTVKKMKEISKVVDESAKVIEILGKRSEEIGEIVGVITGISDQTNLLALNAAIEAARAGEQGRGFAVVAEEVKNLAEDSREAAERIAKMIKEVQQETNKAVEAMQRGTKTAAEGIEIVDETGKAFQDIMDAALQSSTQMSAIAQLMDSQKDGTQRAAKSVDGIASIAEETASASEESASSTEELTASMEDMTARAQSLSEMAINLKKVAGQFKVSEEQEEEFNEPLKHQAPPRKIERKKPLIREEKAKVPSKVKEALAKRGIETN